VIGSGEDVFISGRYYNGLFQNFLTFPSTLQTVTFDPFSADAPAVSASTRDGQQITLEVSFQFRLRINELSSLYAKYGLNYRPQFITIATQAIKNLAATTYDTTDFFEIREFISEAMHVAVNNVLWPEYCVVEHFQLAKITPPAATDRSILNKIIEQQNINIAAVNRNRTLILAESSTIMAAAESQIVVVHAEAARQGQLLVGNATAAEILAHLNATAFAYEILGSSLGYNSSQLLMHMMYEHVRGLDGPNSAVTVDFPTALLSLN